MKRSILYGLRGTFLKYMTLTSIVPIVICILSLYLIARSALLSTAEQTMKNTTQNIERMCKVQSDEIDSALAHDIERAWRSARDALDGLRNMTLSEATDSVTVTNQETEEKTTIDLPRLSAGNAPLLKNYSIPDDVVQRCGNKGATSTVFQLHDGKLIRVSTNVRNKEGERANLSYLPADSLVTRTIIAGKSYRGRALVMGTWSITHYEPIVRKDGKVMGALYLGIPAPKTAIFDMIKETRLGRHGYVYIMNTPGQLIEHPFWKGKSLAQFTDRSSGERLNKVVNGNRGRCIEYIIPGKDGKYSAKHAFVTYFKPWDWNIVAMAEYNDILYSLNIVFIVVVIMLIVLPLVIFPVAGYLSTRITTPFRRIIQTTETVSEGDLSVFIPQKHYVKCAKLLDCKKVDCPAYSTKNLSCWAIPGTVLDENGVPLTDKDKIEKHCSQCRIYKNAIRGEIDELIEAINKMIVTMQSIIRSIKTAESGLSEDAGVLARTSLVLREESQIQAASIEETTSANEELAATIDSVSEASNKQADKMSQTSAAMEELTASTRNVGQHSIDLSKEAARMVEEAKQTGDMLERTTANIVKLEDSSRKIGAIIAIINDISDQINLLSLNAAIESARAGEHGKGFAVVAEEISKLADATAQSTKEIETLIKTSGSDIASGAALVNQTTGAIKTIIAKIESAARLIQDIAISSEEQIKSSEQVMSDVEEANRMSLQIAQANDEQKHTSTEILKAVSQINESLQKVAGSSTEVSQSAQSMKDRAHALHEILIRFKIRD